MELRFISSLTPEDENRLAPSILKAVCVLLDHFPIPYTLRIVTGDQQVFEHAHAPSDRVETRVQTGAINAKLEAALQFVDWRRREGADRKRGGSTEQANGALEAEIDALISSQSS